MTIDTMALHFAAILTHIPVRFGRLIFSAIVGALASVIYVLLPEAIIPKLLVALLSLVPVTIIATKGISIRRRFSFLLCFIMFCALLGGMVNFVFGIFDRYIRDAVAEYVGSGVNRQLLLIALAVLISIGVLRMVVLSFSNGVSPTHIDVEITYGDARLTVNALVDSGNLAVDPLDMQPILLLKEEKAVQLFADHFWELRDPDSYDPVTRKRLRLIPISQGGTSRVLAAIKADRVEIVRDNKNEAINVTIAIDKKGGSFGGCDALIPASALSNVNL